MLARKPFLPLLAALVGLSATQSAIAFPCFDTQPPTLREDLAASQAVVVLQAVSMPPVKVEGGHAEVAGKTPELVDFQVTRVLKSDAEIRRGHALQLVVHSKEGEGHPPLYYAMLKDGEWTPAIQMSKAEETYLTGLAKRPRLTPGTPDAAEFYWAYWDSSDLECSKDAIRELLECREDDLRDLAGKFPAQRVRDVLNDNARKNTQLRFAHHVLRLRGKPEPADLELLHRKITSQKSTELRALDELVASYLAVKGESGLKLVEERFLSNRDAEYADTYGALMALRAHLKWDYLPRERVLESLRLMLDRSDLADLVIMDLARAEDWSVIDRLGPLFKHDPAGSNWSRVPVLRYLMVCPRPEAQRLLEELAEIDPDALKRAKNFFLLEAPPDGAVP